MAVPNLIQTSVFGHLINKISRGKLFSYPEEVEGFVIPSTYLANPAELLEKETGAQNNLYKCESTEVLDSDTSGDISLKSESIENSQDSLTVKKESDLLDISSDLEKGNEIESSTNKLNPDYILVDWYGPDDPENPQNWSILKKVWIIFSMAFLTVSIYMGSSIYTPGAHQMMADLNTTRVKATLPLTTFVLGYAFGPMVLSPLSEHAPFGRNIIYSLTLLFFSVIQIPTALSSTIETITGLRLLAGIAASPSLSTGGATIGDILSQDYVTVGLVAWSIGAFSGPTVGPFIGGLLTQLVGWRWNFWFLCIVSGVSFITFSVFLPETSHATILYRRAARLRKLTGNPNIKCQHDLEEHTSTKNVIKELIWRPIFIAFFEPIAFALNIYLGFVYVIINSWFEALPIVFTELYGFNIIENGVVYIAAITGGIIGAGFYLLCYFRILDSAKSKIERFLIPSMIGGFFLPVALFLFAWGSSTHTHWMAPVVSLFLFGIGTIFVFQSVFAYLSRGFPRFIASVFAGNTMVRSVLAGIFPLFTYPMYKNLEIKDYPVGRGGSIWASISLLVVAIPFVIYHFGVRLRGKSKYAN